MCVLHRNFGLWDHSKCGAKGKRICFCTRFWIHSGLRFRGTACQFELEWESILWEEFPIAYQHWWSTICWSFWDLKGFCPFIFRIIRERHASHGWIWSGRAVLNSFHASLAFLFKQCDDIAERNHDRFDFVRATRWENTPIVEVFHTVISSLLIFLWSEFEGGWVFLAIISTEERGSTLSFFVILFYHPVSKATIQLLSEFADWHFTCGTTNMVTPSGHLVAFVRICVLA